MLTVFLVSILTLVQLNCENLFDCSHDEGKNDTEFTAEGKRHWTKQKYWQKTENIAKELIGCCGKDTLPDLITLCEVENDSVMERLTRRTALGRLGYRYIMTNSRDERGIDVALLYRMVAFMPICQRVITPDDNYHAHPLRDILYVCGRTPSNDTLHVVIVHAPSKFGSAKKSEKRRLTVINKIIETIDSVRTNNQEAKIIISGDFNDTAESTSMLSLENNEIINVTKTTKGYNGAKGSYKYKGRWESIDHILVSPSIVNNILESRIYDASYLIEEDNKYGGVRPRRSYKGLRFDPSGHSDHLPIILKLYI